MNVLRELVEAFRTDSNKKNIPRASGIYQITCITTGKIYVGRAVNLRARWDQHKNELKRSNHHNVHLQKAWNEYGAECFVFAVLELVPKQQLIEREQEWIDLTFCIDRAVGFNISNDAIYPSGMHAQVWEGFVNPKGDSVTITNLNDFCRQNGLDNASMIRLAQGKSKLKSYKGWTHKNSVRQRDYIKTWDGFIDPNGNAVGTISNLAAFCRENGLDDTHMIALANGKLHQHLGWTHINKRENLGHKTYTGFMNPKGQRVVVSNLQEFCRKNNLHPVHMHQLINGQRKSDKGWTWRPENENE